VVVGPETKQSRISVSCFHQSGCMRNLVTPRTDPYLTPAKFRSASPGPAPAPDPPCSGLRESHVAVLRSARAVSRAHRRGPARPFFLWLSFYIVLFRLSNAWTAPWEPRTNALSTNRHLASMKQQTGNPQAPSLPANPWVRTVSTTPPRVIRTNDLRTGVQEWWVADQFSVAASIGAAGTEFLTLPFKTVHFRPGHLKNRSALAFCV
jgi:hypothetical protein